jgi:peptidoglycan/LPS O-acetylase OafA/YrhL
MSRLIPQQQNAFFYFVYVFVVDYQIMFVSGMLAAELHRRDMIRLGLPAAKFALALALVAMFSARLLFGYASRWAILIEGLGCAGVVGVLARYHGLRLRAALETSPIQFLGRISYSFYLYHAMALAVVLSGSLRLLPTGVEPASVPGTLILALWSVAATTAMAWTSYNLVERPAMRIGRRF